ncbi:MAG: DUF1851 domain-containing protein [Deltaproteobacteria bacterium]|jgi:hypothetical protein|nr:DUF1851 domain-containing protein [Deltaproteobacteria bacterium]
MAEPFEKFIKAFTPPKYAIKLQHHLITYFEGILPAEIFKFWGSYGFGDYANGLIKVVNPIEYADPLYEWLGAEDPSKVPILVTGFGDIFYYRKLSDFGDEDVCFLDIHHRNIDICAYSLKDFFESFIVNKSKANNLLKSTLFKKAVLKKGILQFEEIYYFVPALILGGKEDIKHVDKGNGVTHQSLLFQMG